MVGAAATDDGSGYYEVDRSGDVAAFGAAVCYGGMTGTPLNRPIVGMAVDPATGGYWLVASGRRSVLVQRTVRWLDR